MRIVTVNEGAPAPEGMVFLSQVAGLVQHYRAPNEELIAAVEKKVKLPKGSKVEVFNHMVKLTVGKKGSNLFDPDNFDAMTAWVEKHS